MAKTAPPDRDAARRTTVSGAIRIELLPLARRAAAVRELNLSQFIAEALERHTKLTLRRASKAATL